MAIKKNYLVIGILMIMIGAGGFFSMNAKIIGKVIGDLQVNILNNSDSENYLEFSELNEVVVRGGDKTKFAVMVNNPKEKVATNCKLLPKNLVDWISNSEIKNILSNKKTNFELELNVPKIDPGIYEAEIEIICDNSISESKKFNIKILEKPLEIIDITQKNRKINVSYVFNNENFFGDSVFVEIWAVDSNGFEIKRVVDSFIIRKEGLIERSILLELEPGIYDIYFALSSDIDNYLKESFIVGESFISGKAILKIAKGKGIPYLIFLLIIGLGFFLIFKGHRENVQDNNQEDNELE